MNIVNEFAIKKLSSIVIPEHTTTFNVDLIDKVSTIIAAIQFAGFKLDESVIRYMLSFDTKQELNEFYKFFKNTLNALKGGNLQFKVLRESFVDNPFALVSDEETFIQLVQYLFYSNNVGGHTKPKAIENINVDKLQTIYACTLDEVVDGFRQVLSSKDSSNDDDKKMVVDLVKSYKSFSDAAMDTNIPHKEMLANVVYGLYEYSKKFEKDTRDDYRKQITNKVGVITDVLRVAVAMSNGDTSLSEMPLFLRFNRQQRKFLCNAIKHCLKNQSEFNFNEDLMRHSSKWKLLSKFIHVGDYGLHGAFKPLRDNDTKVKTFNSIVTNDGYSDAIRALKSRPTEFVRKLNETLIMYNDKVDDVLSEFERVGGDASLNALISAKYHFDNIDRDRFIMPKSGKATFIELDKSKLDEKTALKAANAINQCIDVSLSRKDMMEGDYYIDPTLYNIKLPTAMRNASSGLLQVGRGSRLPLNQTTEVIRLFTHWIGDDLDLSLSLLDSNFKVIDTVAYYNQNHDAVINHSGDYTFAPEPDGASEFVDIDIGSLPKKIRYGLMYVNVFSGPKLSNMEHCVTGWCERDSLKSHELFDPSKVKNLIKLETNGRECIPLIIDFNTKEIIWTDMTCENVGSTINQGSNLLTRNDELGKLLSYMINNNRVSVGELLELNIKNRGGIMVDEIDEDTIVYDCTVGYDATWINSELL